jgi:DNA-binding response OmpR family regulator
VIKILVVEDSQECQDIIKVGLKDTYELHFAKTLAGARELLSEQEFKVALLDMELPDGKGIDLCEDLGVGPGFAVRPYPLVIFLTRCQEVQAKLSVFSMGVADYITKPFDHRELKARIKVRLEERASLPSVLLKGGLEIDLVSHKVSCQVDGEGVEYLDLTPLEYKLLMLFIVSENGEVIPREVIKDKIWQPDSHVSNRVIDTHISNLRKKLTKNSQLDVRSVYSTGYRLVELSS